MKTINDCNEPPHHIWLETSFNVLNDCKFRKSKNVIPVDEEMIKDRDW